MFIVKDSCSWVPRGVFSRWMFVLVEPHSCTQALVITGKFFDFYHFIVLYFTWSIVAEDAGEHDATFLYCAHMNAREMESNSIISLHTHTYVIKCINQRLKWLKRSEFISVPSLRAIQVGSGSGGWSRWRGNQAIARGRWVVAWSATNSPSIPKYVLEGLWLSLYSDYCISWLFLFADVFIFASWGRVKID